MPVKLNSTGGGSVTLTTPSTGSDFTVTIPAATGTMVTTTSASTIEFAAGSAAAPSITTTGDTNTGIFFPAADTIAFTEGGVEAMRIDSSGNVGIGTSSPGSAYRLAVSGNNTGMSIQDTGSVGTWLDFKTGSGTVQGNIYFNFTNGYMTFGTAAAGSSQVERARINSSGLLLVGTTTGLAGHTFQNSSGATTYRPTTTTGFGIHHFYSDVSGTSSLKAYVQADGTYINASDEKLKTNIVKARSYLNDLMRIEIVNYTWKGGEDNEKKLGVIAQQVESVFPSLVKEVIGSPATGETQKMLPQEVFIPMLITAIQELTTKLESAEARIAALEAK